MNKYQKFYIDSTLDSLDTQFKQVNKELEAIYKKFSKNREKLIAELSKTMMDYKVSAEFMDLTAKERIQINKKMQMSIYDIVNEEKTMEKEYIKRTLGDAVVNTYKYQEYILSLGIEFDILPLPEKTITKIVNNKILDKRWDYRLWGSKDILSQQLRKDVDQFLNGKISVNKIGQNIRETYKSNFYNSQRLVRTEVARVQSEILNVFDKEHDIEWQLFLGTLDSLTSKVCREKDGKQYRTDDIDKPIPPLHPNCRSVLVGVIKDYKPTTRRNNETGDIIDYKDYKAWLQA